MAKVFDDYEIDIRLSGEPESLNASGVSFSMKESIYQMLPTLSLDIQDPTGGLQESLYFTKGAEIEVGFGESNGEVDRCMYRVVQDLLPNSTQNGSLAGTVQVEAIHNWYFSQQAISNAYNNTPTNVFRDRLNASTFFPLQLEDTTTPTVFYQPMEFDMDFLKNRVLPHCYSTNYPRSPFYAYGTTDNAFHLKSASAMYANSSVASLEYLTNPRQMRKSGKHTIMDISRIQDDTYKNRMQNKLHTYYIDTQTGEMKTERTRYKDIVPPIGNSVSLYSQDDLSNQTDYFNYFLRGRQTADVRLLTAKINDYYRYQSFVDRLHIVTPLNMQLRAGNKIDITVHMTIGSNEEIAQTFSGEYVIESREHIWNADEQRAFTSCIIGRKYASIPSTYPLFSELS